MDRRLENMEGYRLLTPGDEWQNHDEWSSSPGMNWADIGDVSGGAVPLSSWLQSDGHIARRRIENDIHPSELDLLNPLTRAYTPD